MKKILLLTFSTFCTLYIAQTNISDYKYVSVPAKFADKKMNNFGLNDLLKLEMKKKKYVVISDNNAEWPDEAKNNPCSVLTAVLDDTSNLLRNRLDLNLQDCHGKLLLNSKGTSMIKEYEEAFHEALKLSMQKVPVSSPIDLPTNSSQITTTTKTVTSTTTSTPAKEETKIIANNSKTKTSSSDVQIYTNGKIDLQKILIGNGQFILVNPNSSVPFATFEPSSKKDTFRVTLENNSMTLGYFENNSLIIEMPNSSGGFNNEIFKLK